MVNLTQTTNGISARSSTLTRAWRGDPQTTAWDAAGIAACLNRLDQPIFVIGDNGRIGFTNQGVEAADGSYALLASALPLEPGQLGDATFRDDYGVKLAYASGAMANAIASADLVIAMGRAGLLSSFGAAGVVGPRLEA